jgi:hypothetical protein
MNELTKDQWEKSMSTGFGNGDHPINHNNPHHDKLVVKLENAEMAMSDMTKVIKYSAQLQKMFNVNDDLEDWVKAKLNHACDYVATVRDYLKFYHDEKSLGTSDQEINEKWTRKYKTSIDCSNPKGFSQKAHCAGRRARRAGKQTRSSSVSEVEIYNEVLKDLIEDILEEDSAMAMGAVKQINSDAQELQSMLKPTMQLPDWCKAKLNLAGEYLDDVYHHLDHFGSEGRKFDENINELDYEGAVGFHELMTFYGKASDEQRQQMDDCLTNKNVECVKDLVHQVTGMTMANISESDLTPSFYKEKDRRLRMSVRPVVSELAFWVSPTGEVIRVGDHTRWVRDNRVKIIGFNANEPYTSAFRNGYIRLVYLPQDNALRLHNSGEDTSYGFYVNGNERTGTPPVTSQTKDAIRQFIKEKNVLVVFDDRGKLRIDEIMNESWGKTLSTAALAAATMFGTPQTQANAPATPTSSITTTVQKQSPYTVEDIIAATLVDEAGGEKNAEQGMHAVLNVIMNRVKGDVRKGAMECLRPKQFSGWNKVNKKSADDIKKFIDSKRGHKQFKNALMLVGQAKNKSLKDITKGSNHFLNVQLTKQQRKGGNLPSWYDSNKVVADVGQHRFLKLEEIYELS